MDISNEKLNKIRIAELLKGLPRLKVFDEQLKEWEDLYPFSPSYPIVDRNSYIGVEVELENLDANAVPELFWRRITDGSLRNNGAEFITNPIRAWRIENALNQLFNNVNSDIEFSHRTSIHIHLNIRTLTMDEIRSLVLLYILFEKPLFEYAGKERYENIFCVPLNEFDLTHRLENLFQNGIDYLSDWEKYTALNLNPISSKGTIEFRHLKGTKDIKHIINWINLILCLKIAALKYDPETLWKEIRELNTSSQYELFGMRIFEHYFNLINNQDYRKQISSSISHAKACCIPNKLANKTPSKLLTWTTQSSPRLERNSVLGVNSLTSLLNAEALRTERQFRTEQQNEQRLENSRF